MALLNKDKNSYYILRENFYGVSKIHENSIKSFSPEAT